MQTPAFRGRVVLLGLGFLLSLLDPRTRSGCRKNRHQQQIDDLEPENS